MTVSATGTFSDKNVDTGKTVTLSETYAGTDRNNYTITSQGSTTADITAKAITVTNISASDKEYNGNTAATIDVSLASFTDLVDGDTVTVSATGTFSDKNVDTGKTVTLSETYAGTDRNNYTITSQGSTTADITAKAITVTNISASDKEYNGNTAATIDVSLASFTDLVDGDTVTVSATGTFSDKNVDTGKTVTLSETYAGTDRNNYTITSQGSTTADITAKAITVTNISASDKEYNGNTAATIDVSLASFTDLVDGDTVTVSATGTFSDKNVDTGKTVTLSETYAGTDRNNYTITSQGSTTADITAKAITVTNISASDKEYNGNTAATIDVSLASFTDLVDGDTVTVSATGTFSDKNVDTGKTVTLSETYAGTDRNNYTITSQGSTTADITAKAITVTNISASDKEYNGNTAATIDVSLASFTDLVDGDTVTVSATGTFSDKNVDTGKTVTLSETYAGTDRNNYTITSQGSTTADITAKAITVTNISASDKEYNGNTAATIDVSLASFTDLVDGDTVTVSATGTFSDKNVDTGKTVTLSETYAGTDRNNYTITSQGSTTADITAKAITVTNISASDKEYNGNTAATIDVSLASFTDLVDGDTVTVSATGTFSDKNVDTGKTVTLSETYAGTDRNNYTITSQGSTTADITAKAITVTNISASDKEYNGNTAATIDVSLASFTDLVDGDTVTVSATGTFSDKNVDTGKTVTLSETYAGTDRNNYTITSQGSTTADITAKAITVTNISASDKEYNGNTAATIDVSLASFTDLVDGDTVTVSATGTFSDKNVDTGKTVTLSETYAGTDRNNYTITSQGSTTADITAKAITVTNISASDKEYNGNTAATIDVSLASFTDLVDGDTVTVSATGTFSDKNVDTGKTVTLSETYAGTDRNNYTITSQGSTTADITAKAITVTNISASDKEYNGNTAATIDVSLASFTDLVDGDTVTVSATGTFSDKNVDTGKTVTLSETYAGTDRNNYTITSQGSTTADITAKAITVTNISASDKEYNGNTAATIDVSLASFTDLVDGDTVTVSATGTFSDKNVDTGKTVTLSETYAGTDRNNYTITSQGSTTADITAKAITVTNISASDKEYNGNTAATIDVSLASFTDLVDGDTVTVSATGTFSDKNVDTGKTVTLSETYAGTDRNNYTITSQGSTTADITAKAITVTNISASDKEYNGNTAATIDVSLASFTDLVDGDTVTVSATGTFSDKNVDTGKTVTLSETYAGTDRNNYTITSQGSTTADITAKAITVTNISASDKEYNGNTAATIDVSLASFTDLVDGDTVTVSATGTFSDKNVDTGKTVTLSETYAGTDRNNYTITSQGSTTADITAKAITVTNISASDKEYNGNTAATIDVSLASFTDLVDGDTVTVSATGTFSDKNVDTGKTVTLSETYAGTDRNNYTITSQGSTTADITAKAITVTNISASDKEYNGNTAATIDVSLASFTDLVDGDTVTVSATGTFSDKNVDTGKTVTLSETYAGTDRNNYTITSQGSTTADITAKAITVTNISASDKEYNGNTAATIDVSLASFTDLVDGDTVTVSATGTFSDKNVDTGKTVTLSETYAGTDRNNYTITSQGSTTADITAKAITVTNISASDKEYNGNTAATIDVSLASFTDLVDGDTVTVSATGTFSDKNVDTGKTVTLSETYAGTDRNNYTITSQGSTTADITAKAITVTNISASDKEYNGNTAATIDVSLASFTDLVDGDTVTVSATGTFSDKNVDTGKTVTLSETYAGTDRNNYTITSQGSTTADITAKAITVTNISASDKEYNGNTAATIDVSLASFTDLVDGDTVTVSATGTFSDKNVDTGKTVTLSETYAGTDRNNYTITSQGSTTADITAKAITVTNISASDKEYNGNTAATIDVSLASFTDLVDGDTVTVSATGTFSDKNVDTGKTVTLSETYAGTDRNNYTITSQGSTTADITAKAITVTNISASDKEYNGNTAATIDVSLASFTDLVDGDTVTVSATGTFSDKNVDTGKTVTLSETYAGTDRNNYTITSQGSTTADITAKAITVTNISASDKEYNGNTAATIDVSLASFTDLVDGDTVTVSATGTFSDKNVDTGKTVTLSETYAGTDRNNYTITSQGSTTADITAKAITVTNISASDKEYNGNTAATIDVSLASFTDLVDGDTVTVSATGTFSDKNVDTGKTVTLSETYAGTDRNNYTITSQGSTTADITAKAITVTNISASDKEYNGNTAATIDVSLASFTDLVDGDTVTVSATGTFSDKNVDTGKTVTLSETYAGTDRNNYTITSQGSTTADITAKAITVTNISASDKEYNGNTAATIDVSLASFTDLVDGDTVTVSATGTFSDKNVDTGKTVTLSETYAGTDRNNYTITSQGSTTADITAKAITVTNISASDKEYNGNTAATIDVSLASFTDLVDGDTVTVSATGTFSDKNVDTGKTVTLSETYAGTDRNNYTITSQGSTTADITAKAITVTNISASDKEYNGNTAATIDVSLASFTDLVDGDTVTVSATGTFSDKNVDTGKTVTLSETYAGTDRNNYTITSQGSTTADITAKAITVTNISASDKEYNGNTAATIDVSLASFTDLVDGDTVTVSATGTFSDKNVDTGKTVTLSETYAGTDRNNYTITSQGSTTADITAKAITVTNISASDKEYNGNTAATIDVSLASFTDLVDGDTVTVSATGTFSDKNVDTGKTVTLSETYAGTDRNNYTITSQGSTTADITAKAITVTNISASDKEYNGNTAATIDVSLASFTDLVDGDTVTVSATGTFSDKNVDTGKTVTLSETYAGTDRNNYTITSQGSTTADITAKAITVTNISASDKEYNGNTAATIDVSLASFTDLVDGDTVTVSATGTFSDKNVDTGKTVTLSETYAGTDRNNYTITSQGSTTADITAKAITVTNISASDKEYNGNTAATIDVSLASFTDLVDGDTVTVSATGTFSDKNVDTGKTVTLSETYAGTDRNNYTITSQGSTTADITAKAITVTNISASDKEYNGNTAATIDVSLASFTDLVDGDTVTVSATGTFSDKNVDTGKTVTLSETYAGTDRNNYTITSQGSTTADITAKAITVTNISASDKEYNGNTAATIDVSLASFTDLVDGDTVTVSATGTFSDKNVDTGKTVTLSETYAGTDRNNYTITSQGSTTADITAKAITVTNISASDKEYNGNTAATIDVSLASFTDLVDGDTVTVSATGTFSDKNVDTGKTVTLSETYAGTDRNNYTITSQGSTTADITAKAITVTNISASDKEYNGNTAATIDVSLASFTDLVDGDTVTVSATGTFSDKNVDTGKTVTLSETYAGTDRNNYTITSQGSTTADITAKAITVTNISASDKEYNGNTAATIDVSLASFTDLVDGDTVTVSATGTFSDKNVDTGKTVTLSETYAGTDRNNYTITSQGSTTADITAKAITVTNISASDKEYNGNTAATIDVSLASFTDLVDGDTVTVSATGTFSDKNVDTGKTVTLSETYAGTDRNNYTITSQGSTTADITAKAITVTNISASDKEYNGNTAATIDVSLASFTDLVDGDTVTVSATGTFSDKNVDTGKTVTLSETYAGTDRNNYTITSQGSTTADITAKLLTVNAELTSATKEYDGTTTAVVTRSGLEGLVADEDITATGGGNYDNMNVGTGKAITINFTLQDGETSGLASNYTISEQTINTGIITTKTLTYTVAANDKTYDGNTTASVALTFSGTIGSETVTESNSSTFDTKNVGSNKTVTVNSITLADGANGGLASNYSISTGGTTTADISAAALTYTVAANDKTYDGNTTASVALTFSGTMGSETLTATNTATFDTKNAGTGKTVTVNSITLSDGTNGGLATNYSITTGNTTTADINVKALTVNAELTSATKIYDGNATAEITNASLIGLVGDEDVTAIGSGTYDNKNVGTGKTITISYTLQDGASGSASNYLITPQTSINGVITQANLSVIAINSAKFAAADDPIYTFSYSGFKGSDSAGDLDVRGSVARSNEDNAVGTYEDVLTPAGFSDNNYTFSYNSADLTIVPADGLLVRLGDNSVSYGETVSYDSVEVVYWDANAGREIISLEPVITDDSFLINDGAGTIVNFDVLKSSTSGSCSEVNCLSSSLKTKVDAYNLSPINYSKTGENFNSLVVTGSLTVNKKSIDPDNLTFTSASKEYDGDNIITYENIDYNQDNTSVYLGDLLVIKGSGVYDSRHVGTEKIVTADISLSGDDSNNYNITGDNRIVEAIGTITQLESVQWVGSAENTNWSESANWAGGAIPDESNVGTIIIGNSYDTVYDADSFGSTSSSITNNGSITLNTADTFTMSNAIAGTGNVLKSGSGTFTLSGANTYTGDTNVSVGTLKLTGSLADTTDLVVASDSTFDLQVTHTFASLDLDGTISNSALIAAKNIVVTGISQLGGTLTTTGKQTFSGATTLTSDTILSSSDVVTFSGAVNSEIDETNALTITASEAQFDGVVGGTQGVGAITITGTLDLNADIESASSLSVSLTSDLEADVATTAQQKYTGATTLSDNVTLSSGDLITFSGTVNSEASETNSLSITASEAQFDSVVGGTQALGAITITGTLDLNADIESASSLSVSSSTDLSADVNTAGNQAYNGNVVVSGGTLANPLDIFSSGGNILFNGTLKAGMGSKAAQRTLRINNPYQADDGYLNAGSVTFNDNVGYAFKNLNYQSLVNDNFYSLEVTGNSIYLNADVMTFENQEYSGPVIVGNNGVNGYTRTVFSMDPSVTFNHTVDDSQANLHTLVVSALALSVHSEQIPTITFEGVVGGSTPLDELVKNIGIQDLAGIFETVHRGSVINGQSITYNGTRYNESQTITTFAGDSGTDPVLSASPSFNVDGGIVSSSVSLDQAQAIMRSITNINSSSNMIESSVEVGQPVFDSDINFNDNISSAEDNEEESEEKTMLCALDDPEAVGADCAVE